MKKLRAALLRSFRGQHSEKLKGSARGNWDPWVVQQPFRPNPNGVGDRTTMLRRPFIGCSASYCVESGRLSVLHLVRPVKLLTLQVERRDCLAASQCNATCRWWGYQFSICIRDQFEMGRRFPRPLINFAIWTGIQLFCIVSLFQRRQEQTQHGSIGRG